MAKTKLRDMAREHLSIEEIMECAGESVRDTIGNDWQVCIIAVGPDVTLDSGHVVNDIRMIQSGVDELPEILTHLGNQLGAAKKHGDTEGEGAFH